MSRTNFQKSFSYQVMFGMEYRSSKELFERFKESDLFDCGFLYLSNALNGAVKLVVAITVYTPLVIIVNAATAPMFFAIAGVASMVGQNSKLRDFYLKEALITVLMATSAPILHITFVALGILFPTVTYLTFKDIVEMHAQSFASDKLSSEDLKKKIEGFGVIKEDYAIQSAYLNSRRLYEYFQKEGYVSCALQYAGNACLSTLKLVGVIAIAEPIHILINTLTFSILFPTICIESVFEKREAVRNITFEYLGRAAFHMTVAPVMHITLFALSILYPSATYLLLKDLFESRGEEKGKDPSKKALGAPKEASRTTPLPSPLLAPDHEEGNSVLPELERLRHRVQLAELKLDYIKAQNRDAKIIAMLKANAQNPSHKFSFGGVLDPKQAISQMVLFCQKKWNLIVDSLIAFDLYDRLKLKENIHLLPELQEAIRAAAYHLHTQLMSDKSPLQIDLESFLTDFTALYEASLLEEPFSHKHIELCKKMAGQLALVSFVSKPSEKQKLEEDFLLEILQISKKEKANLENFNKIIALIFANINEELKTLGDIWTEFKKLWPIYKEAYLQYQKALEEKAEAAAIEEKRMNLKKAKMEIQKCLKESKIGLKGLELEASFIEEVYNNPAAYVTPPAEETSAEEKTETIENCINLTLRAKNKELPQVLGREEEVEKVLEILSRSKGKNNPVLLGEAGVGKTAIVEGVAQRIADGDVPETLKDKQIFALKLSDLLKNIRYVGDLEKELDKVLAPIIASNGQKVLFIDEIHMIAGAGASSKSEVDLANLLKPYLDRGDIRLIAATTVDEYAKLTKDPALERRFDPYHVTEMGKADVEEVLGERLFAYEAECGIKIEPEVIETVYTLGKELKKRHFPDKGIDILKEAAYTVKSQIQHAQPHIINLKKFIRQLKLTQNLCKLGNADSDTYKRYLKAALIEKQAAIEDDFLDAAVSIFLTKQNKLEKVQFLNIYTQTIAYYERKLKRMEENWKEEEALIQAFNQAYIAFKTSHKDQKPLAEIAVLEKAMMDAEKALLALRSQKGPCVKHYKVTAELVAEVVAIKAALPTAEASAGAGARALGIRVA